MQVSESTAMYIRRIERADVPTVVDACQWLFDPPGAAPSLWDPEAAAIRLNDLCTAHDGTALVALFDRSLIGSAPCTWSWYLSAEASEPGSTS